MFYIWWVMVTGMNTDVRPGASVLHVQTEDLGGEQATIQTLVSDAGRILTSIRRSHPELTAGPDTESLPQLSRQHRTAIQAVCRGRI